MAGAKRTDNRGRNLRSGEGQRAEDGRYFYRYSDLAGKRRTIYALTLQELRQKEQQITRDLEDRIDSNAGSMTLNELFDLFMTTKADIRETTRKNYYVVWNNDIKETALGNMAIKQIRQIHVCALYGDLSKRGLAESTIKLCHTLILSALELALCSDYIRKNPARDAQKWITGEKADREAITRAQQTALLEFMQNSIYETYYPMIVFDLSTGIRVGELAGLRWKDVDLKKTSYI
ncbi:MAG: integrase DNA-binding domain-containing protein [Lachnospiraceae bacterium]|nr:integrase DNA-binding domain-containing protein [Lachnospiraceae bacterium]